MRNKKVYIKLCGTTHEFELNEEDFLTITHRSTIDLKASEIGDGEIHLN